MGKREWRWPPAQHARLLFVLLLPSLMAASGAAVVATTCAPKTAAQSAQTADAIFYGSAVSQKERPDLGPTPFGTPWEVSFLVDKAFKGSVTRELQVLSDTSFRVGANYTVFATLRDHSFATSACSGNVEGEIDPRAYGLAGEVALLDETSEQTPPTPGDPSSVGSAALLPGVVAGLAVVGVASAVLFYVLRRKAHE